MIGTVANTVASILAGDGGNTVETVAARLALIGHAPGRYNAAAWIQSDVRIGDQVAAVAHIGRYADDVQRHIRSGWSDEWEREFDAAEPAETNAAAEIDGAV